MDIGPSDSRTSLTLMRRLRADPQDVAAWDEFLFTYGPRIDAWCRRWKLQEADIQDVTQNILLKLSQQFGRFQYDPTQSFRGWLRRVTESALSDFVTLRQRTKATSGVPEALYGAEAKQDLLTRLGEAFDLEVLAEARTRVRVMVDPMHWKAFSLMTDDSLSASETAKECGLSVANTFQVKSRVQRLIREEIRHLDNGSSHA